MFQNQTNLNSLKIHSKLLSLLQRNIWISKNQYRVYDIAQFTQQTYKALQNYPLNSKIKKQPGEQSQRFNSSYRLLSMNKYFQNCSFLNFRLSILNPSKRDGSIISCKFDNTSKQLITQSNQVILNCIRYLECISKCLPKPYELSQYPKLPPLSVAEVTYLQSQMFLNKSFIFDGFSDRWFKIMQQPQLLQNWWNSVSMQLLSRKSFEILLIPLNKVLPNLSSASEFRLIAVLSPAIKWLEFRFKPKLQLVVDHRINNDQNGFVSQCSTQMNMFLLINEIQKYKTNIICQKYLQT
ncbi:hypothetical protein ABPG74_002838 [Tetrahymena malaccensis]